MRIGNAIGVDWNLVDREQFRRGIEVELEHGLVNRYTNVTDNDRLITGKIALAHLNEFPDYYSRLKVIEDPKFSVANANNPNNNELLKGLLVGAGVVLLGKVLLDKAKQK